MTAPATVKPFLKWNGSKRQLADLIDTSFGPCQGVWRENMIGSGAVFFLRASRGTIRSAVLSDANPRLIATYIALRDQVDGVLAELDLLDWSEGYREGYYTVRDAFNRGAPSGPTCAARLIYLNKAGYNGLYRENKSGGFNVPVGRYKRPSRPSEDHLRSVSRLLSIADLRILDCTEAADLAQAGDQLYSDPPYIPASDTSAFTQYTRGGFGPSEQKALVESLDRARRRGVHVGYSNSDTETVHDLCRSVGLPASVHDVRRSSSAKSSGRGIVKEVLTFGAPIKAAETPRKYAYDSINQRWPLGPGSRA